MQEFWKHASYNPVHWRFIKNENSDNALSASQLTINKSMDNSQKPIIMHKVKNKMRS